MTNRLMIIRQGYLHYFVVDNVIVVPKNVTNESSSLLSRSFILEPTRYFHYRSCKFLKTIIYQLHHRNLSVGNL